VLKTLFSEKKIFMEKNVIKRLKRFFMCCRPCSQLKQLHWYYSRIRLIGSVVDSITELRKKQLQLLFIMTYKNTNIFITQNIILLVIQNTAFKSY